MELHELGRWLVGMGVVIAIVGGLLMAGGALGLGRLPGDISFGGERFRVYVPLATGLLISIVATILLNLWLRR